MRILYVVSITFCFGFVLNYIAIISKSFGALCVVCQRSKLLHIYSLLFKCLSTHALEVFHECVHSTSRIEIDCKISNNE